MKKTTVKIIGLLLLIFMAASAVLPAFALESDDELVEPMDVVNEPFNYQNNSDFTSNPPKLNDITEVVGTMQMFNNALRIKEAVISSWKAVISDKSMSFDVDVILDENFKDTELIFRIHTQSPVTGFFNTIGKLYSVKRLNNVAGIYDRDDNLLAELKLDGTVYNIHVEATKGSQNYSIYLNGTLLSDSLQFYSTIYKVLVVGIICSSISPDSYITVDNLHVYSRGRKYPQKTSYQEPGEIPEITIPDLVEKDGIEMWVNGVKKESQTPFTLEDGTMYFPLEWLMEAMGDDGKSYYLSKKNSTITRDGKTVTLKNPVKKTDNGTVLVPAQFIAEAYDAKVWLDEAHQMLIVTTGSRKNDNILRSNGSVFIMNGEPYYEISFNKFDLSWQIIADPSLNNGAIDAYNFPTAESCIAAAEEALSQLHNNGFKTIRVFCNNINLNMNEADINRFWTAADIMYDLCIKYDIQVVACLQMVDQMFLPGIYTEEGEWVNYIGEDMYDYIANPESQARKNAYDFIDAYVSRYKDKGCILMWEIQNESNLAVDLGYQTRNITYSALQQGELFADLADRIRMNDPDRLISSGDSVIRTEQWSNFENTMAGEIKELYPKPDTWEERLKVLTLLNKGMSVLSIHGYKIGYGEKYIDEYGHHNRASWKLHLQEAERLGVPLYNGETFGGLNVLGSAATSSSKDIMNTDFNAAGFRENYINRLIDAGVQLTHWWSFHSDRAEHFGDNDTWSIRIDNNTADTFQVVKEANERLKAKYLVNPLAEENTDELGEVPEGFVQDLTEIETDPVETEPVTEPETAPETNPETTPSENNSGCKSVVSFALPTVIMMAAIPVVIKKKKY